MVAEINGWIEIVDAYDFEADCSLRNISIDTVMELAASIGPEAFMDGISLSSTAYGRNLIFIAADRNHLTQVAWVISWIKAIGDLSIESQAVVSIVDSDPGPEDSIAFGFEIQAGEYWVCSLSNGDVVWQKNPFNMVLS